VKVKEDVPEMIESIAGIFASLASAAATTKVFKELIKGKRGDTRALLEELKENLGLCWMVVEQEVDPLKIIPELTTTEYDRILRTEFDFNSLKRKRVQSTQSITNTELAAFIDKKTEDLLENIYDKIKSMKRIYRIDPDNSRIRWRRRIISLQKRMLLLMQHLRS
jgi:uncharacterized protein (UPF0335 family)